MDCVSARGRRGTASSMSRSTPRMNGVSAKLTSHQRQRAPRREHARDLTRGELRVQEVERVGDDHQIEAGRLEGQLFGGRVERAQRDAALRRRRAKLIEHRLRGLYRHHVEATRGERQREMADAGAEIADAATDRPRQLGQRVDQRGRVRRAGRRRTPPCG